ncbi:V-snare-domain-containing protein [Ascobolus immersus RN42]|uniref:Protein transport protein BOS1 n=1 Tax=Ascobolus immersus RN42 TaxID=1160509 RepID=A0A3N4IRI1_ASCIM|nr:V-snare-domain-containing protein [Ascobolus immersus RN42]
MNSLFNAALRQSQNLKKDLDSYSSNPETNAALQGQISASLATLSRTITDYENLARRELVPQKQQQAFERIKNFRKEMGEMRSEFEKVKNERGEADQASNRLELLGRRPQATHTPDNPYAYNSESSSSTAQGAFAPHAPMQDHLLRENSFLQNSHQQLDQFLDAGRNVLDNLQDQRAVLKGAQRRLYSIGTTLGISGDTIRMIERRAKRDKWVFYGGVVVFLIFCWLVVRWLK